MVNAWIEFVKKTKKSYPKMNLKEVLKMIKRKKLYKKTAAPAAAKKTKKKRRKIAKKKRRKKAKTKKAKKKTRKRNTRIKLVKQRKGRCPKGYTPYIEQPGSKMKKRCVEK